MRCPRARSVLAPNRSPERSDLGHPWKGARPAVLLVGFAVGGLHRRMRPAREPSGGGARQAAEAEQAYIVARDAGIRKVGHDLAYHARELVAMPGAGRGESNLIVLGMHVYDEVIVRSVGKHAGLEIHRRAAAVGEVTLSEVPQEPLVVVVRLAVDRLRVDFLLQVVVLTELKARNTVNGEAVEAPLVHQQIEDGEGIGPEVLGARRLQPGQDLPLGHSEPFKTQESPGPASIEPVMCRSRSPAVRWISRHSS